MRTTGKIGLGIAAAFGALYGAYALGRDSQDTSQAKPLEEAVCEEVDTQEIYDRGESRGYVLGLMAGRREGEVIGEREGREDGFERGKQYGLNACNEERYNEGLAACDDSRYAEGMIEGEKLGMEEGRRRFLGSGTAIYEREEYIAFKINKYIYGKRGTYWIKFNKKTGCIERGVDTSDDEGADYFLINETCNNGHQNLNVNFIQKDGPMIAYTSLDRTEGTFVSHIYLREEDFQENQELFLWADNVMQEAARNYFEVR